MKRPGQEECIMRTRKQQIRTLTDNQIRMMTETKNSRDRDYQLMLWGGFLTGLRLTNAITYQEYDAYYKELQFLAEKLRA